MNTSCDTKPSFLNSCHPYVTIGCIISCFICTVVMIWGVYAMRVDMAEMWTMTRSMSTMDMTKTLTPQEEMMREHCKTMPEMSGCEKYR